MDCSAINLVPNEAAGFPVRLMTCSDTDEMGGEIK